MLDGLGELPSAGLTFVGVVQAAVWQGGSRLCVDRMLEVARYSVPAIPPFNHVEFVDTGF
jgi:hypothetical protein